MKGMVLPFKLALETMDFNKAGKIIHQSWLHKKSLTKKISTNAIDDYYATALKKGATGGKVTGAGGGGFLLTFCPFRKTKSFLNGMRKVGLEKLPFKFEPHGSKVVFVQNE